MHSPFPIDKIHHKLNKKNKNKKKSDIMLNNKQQLF